MNVSVYLAFVVVAVVVVGGGFAFPKQARHFEFQSYGGAQPRGGGYFGNCWVGMCCWHPGILEPLAYTRASSAEFCYPIIY